MIKLSEMEHAVMKALGASLDQTDAVLKELTQARERLAEAGGLLGEVLDNHICSDPGGEYDWTICGLCNAYTPDHHEGCVMPAIQSFLSPEAEPEELTEAKDRYNSLVKAGLICPEGE